MPSFDSLTPKRCDYCGKTQLKSTDGSLLSLKRCTRCLNASYHDVDCQNKHWKVHKLVCKPVQLLSIGSLPGRGKCLFVTKPCRLGQVISPTTVDATLKPLIPPVLFRDQRETRCAVCMGDLGSSPISLCELDVYPVRVCSSTCQHSAKGWLEEENAEIQALSSLPLGVLPTGLLCYRLFKAVFVSEKVKKEELDGLFCDLDHIANTPEAIHHNKFVMHFISWIVMATDHRRGADKLSVILFQELLSKIQLNSFTVQSQGTDIGIGLFRTATFINHACEPNARQSFILRPGTGKLPELQLIARADIAADTEVTIAYTDEHLDSTERRQAYLQQHYGFQCDCQRCITSS